jgi:dTDP-4-amino-4,6-dideoxygalactose transaminase
MRVPLLDLKPQYQSLKKELDEAVAKVIESQYFILGPEVAEMECEIAGYVKAKYALGVSSGTDALLIALMAIDIQPDDEVIIPTYSFFATAGVVARLNAIPVFADIDPVTFNIDPQEIEKKITDKTKAIIPVHLYGQSCEMDEIMEIAKKHNVKVIEDAAQAIGTQYKDGKHVGAIGDVGCFSFFPSKNLGCFGDGGVVTTNNEELFNKMKMLRMHGMEPKYYHKIIGGNFRLDALQAAVVRVKLPHLDGWSEQRRKNAELYNKLFIEAGLAEETGKTEFDANNKVLIPKALHKPVTTIDVKQMTTNDLVNYHIYNQYIIRTEKRDELKQYLADNEVMTDIYYPVAFHNQECFQDPKIKSRNSSYPNADFACSHSLALPIYSDLSTEQIEWVVEKIKEFHS